PRAGHMIDRSKEFNSRWARHHCRTPALTTQAPSVECQDAPPSPVALTSPTRPKIRGLKCVSQNSATDRLPPMKAPLLLSLFAASTLLAAAPKPTLANVSYGPHAAQVLDFYKAQSEKPTPLLFVIHGGGWMYGDKSSYNNGAPYLAAGISIVAINYRFL